MAAIGVLVHHERKAAWDVATDLVSWLDDRGHDVRLPEADAMLVGLEKFGQPDDEVAVGADLVVGVGGDGTILRAVELAAPLGVPVLGVNVGQLGYLTMVEPEAMRASMKRFLAGSYDIDERMRLEVVVVRADGTVEPAECALNEAVLERGEPGHTIRIEASFDGEAFTPYVADGLIVSTPTGSTAYAFSVRGPIVAPRHRAIVLVPVAPHMLFDRSMVLEPSTQIRLEVAGHRVARLGVDGRSLGTLAEGDSIVCTAAERPALLVTFGRADFHRVLRSKFALADR
jgi:NAD+ kinase